MKNLVAVLAVLSAVSSFGATAARADGGETGADSAHTQPFWPREDNANIYYDSGRTHESGSHARGHEYRSFDAD